MYVAWQFARAAGKAFGADAGLNFLQSYCSTGARKNLRYRTSHVIIANALGAR